MALPGAAGGQPPSREAQIPMAYSQLDEMMDTLLATLEDLEVRLYVVLRPLAPTPETRAENTPIAVTKCQLAEGLDKVRGRVTLAISRIEVLKQRLEV